MASVIRGNALTSKVLIRYESGRYNADGSVTASATYAVVNSALAFSFPTLGTDTHPLLGTAYKCSGYGFYSLTPKVSALTIDYTANLVGAPGTGSPISPQVEQEATTIAEIEPITSHPTFATFAGTASSPSNGAVWLDDQGKSTGQAGFDSTKAKFSYFGPGTFVGLESYLSPKTEYRYSYSSTSQPSMANVGKIVSSPASAPTLPTGATWLLASINARRSGGSIYLITEIYRASGPNGWNTSVYN